MQLKTGSVFLSLMPLKSQKNKKTLKKIPKEVTISIVVLSSIGLLYFGLNFLKGNNIFSEQRQYYAVYDHVNGLTVDNAVTLNGFKVGKVNKASLILDKPGKILVGIILQEEGLQIPANTIARIISQDLLGTKAIALIFDGDTAFAQIGDTLISEVEKELQESVDERLKPLEKKTKQLLGSIDSAVVIVQTILNTDARDNLSASFKSIKKSFETLEQTATKVDNLVASESEKISSIISNVQSISLNLKENNKQITNVINNFSEISDSLAKVDFANTMMNASRALKQTAEIMTKVNSGEGTIGMLLHNDTLYSNLSSSALELDMLLEDMRVNPKRYVHFSIFGGKDKDKPEKKPR